MEVRERIQDKVIDLERYDQAMKQVAELEKRAVALASEAVRMQRWIEDQFGLKHHQRDPGFPCWTRKGSRYYSTPREALEATSE